MNHQQLTRIFESGATADPLDEIVTLATLTQPTFDALLLRQLHHDTARLFAGTYPEFRASNTLYHNLTHTYSVALATARLLHGLTCNHSQDISIQVIKQALYSAYFHDTGLLMTTSDQALSGAFYTQNHEERSIAVMKQYFENNNFSQAFIQECASVIKCTDLTLAPEDMTFPSPASKLAGYVLGSADILAQMADRCYLERLPFLFQEHQDGGLKAHESAMELMQDTTSFYHNIIATRLEKTFTNTAQAMQAHFHTRWQINDNLYYTNIGNNLGYLSKILQTCENKMECLETFLKRNPTA